MEKMKERLVTFSDGIIAIILTIMVLELPIKLLANGSPDYSSLFRVIGIYFISYCFVGNLWFQLAQAFNGIKRIKNRDFVLYMLLLFFLSLIPSFTRLLIEDTNRNVVVLYGLLTLIISIFLKELVYVIREREAGQEVDREERRKIRQRNYLNITLRVILIGVSYVYPQLALIVYLAMPILGFLQNLIEREEDSYVQQLNKEQQNYYMQDQRQLWGSSWQKYRRLLHDSLSDAKGQEHDAQWWENFNDHWQSQLSQKLQAIDTQIKQSDNPQEIQHLQQEQRRIQQERERFSRKMTHRRESFERRPPRSKPE